MLVNLSESTIDVTPSSKLEPHGRLTIYQHSPVSWKPQHEQTRGRRLLEFTRANDVCTCLSLSEFYESLKTGNSTGRGTMIELNRDEAQAVVLYLKNWLNNTGGQSDDA